MDVRRFRWILSAILLAGAASAALAENPTTRPSGPKIAPPPPPPTIHPEFRPAASRDANAAPLAVLLDCPAGGQGIPKGTAERLAGRGCALWTVTLPAEAWKHPGTPGAIVTRLAESRDRRGRGDSPVVLVVGPAAGNAGMTLLDRRGHPFDGVIWLGVTPIYRGGEGIWMWAPSEAAAGVPMWCVLSTAVEGDGAQNLKLWRQVAATLGKTGSVAFDTHIDHLGATPAPSPAVGPWLEAVSAGKAPPAGADRQARKLAADFAPKARAVETALGRVRGSAARKVSKAGEGMVVSAGVPDGWVRVADRERAYDANEQPYEQLYFADSQAKTPRFARAMVTRAEGDAAGVIESYFGRLRRSGYLVVPLRRTEHAGRTVRLAAVTYPTAKQWHRWLVAASAERARRGLAPLVLAFSATGDDADRLAFAADTLIRTIEIGRPGR